MRLYLDAIRLASNPPTVLATAKWIASTGAVWNNAM
jgi:hypothetical protein